MSLLTRLFKRRYSVMRYGAITTTVLGKSPSDLYNEQPELRAVVSFIQDAVASTPLKVYTREADNDRRRDRVSEAARLIDSPCDDMTTFQLIERIVGDICLYGAALVMVAPNDDRDSGWEATPIPYSWVQSVYTNDGFRPSKYVVNNPGVSTSNVEIDAKLVVRFARYNPDNTFEAVSPVESLKAVLAERMNALQYRNAVWKNGGWVSRWISRPTGTPWVPEQRERFAASWKAKFSGDGTDTGGTPILEDGMQLHDTTLNAKEAQFAESAALTREEVCAAYHINPSLIYHTQTQTYASAKDNARALYSEALAPLMGLICERINKVLLPMIGADAKTYVSFDMSSKLNASFEEQAQVLTSSVGAPWMTADEARARLDMPAMGGSASELVQPLNIAYGDNGVSNALSSQPETKDAKTEYKTRQKPEPDGTAELSSILTKFFARQEKRVLSDIGKKSRDEDWWDSERWDKELADDLEPTFLKLATRGGKKALKNIDLEPDRYDEKRTKNYVRKMSEGKARAVNSVTKRQLEKALEEDEAPKDVFERAKDTRSSSSAVSFATACAVWGGMEAIRQCVPNQYGRYKTWIHTNNSPNSRINHMAMDGETVEFDQPFSNGAMFPHDETLDAEETCNCACQIEITVISPE